MSLTADEIKKIAHLARLAITDEQLNALNKDLDNILQLVEKMNQQDTSKVEPLAHPMDEIQPMRADQVTEINQRDLLLKNAPQATAGLFIVPQFIETE